MTSVRKSIHPIHLIHLPEFYRLSNKDDNKRFNQLIKDDSSIQLFDKITDQLRELTKIRFPSRQFTEEELQAETGNIQNGIELRESEFW